MTLAVRIQLDRFTKGLHREGHTKAFYVERFHLAVVGPRKTRRTIANSHEKLQFAVHHPQIDRQLTAN